MCPNCYSQISFYAIPPPLPLETTYFDRLVVAAHYAPPLSKLITAYKYQKAKLLAPTLVDLIWYSTDLPETDLLTFIPLHPRKQTERGFNQTQLLAQGLAQKTGQPWLNTLIKTRHQLAQAKTTSRAARLTNVSETFAIDPDFLKWLAQQNQPPRSILIVDDVVTTGSTLNEAARVLKNVGVKKVFGLAVAHD